jgi:hypothetical protein
MRPELEVELSFALARECDDALAEEAALAASEALDRSADEARNGTL